MSAMDGHLSGGRGGASTRRRSLPLPAAPTRRCSTARARLGHDPTHVRGLRPPVTARASRSSNRARRSVAPRRRPRLPWALLAVGLVLAIGLWTWTRLRARHPRTPAASSIDALSPQQAYDRGVDLGMQGRALESLPYLARAASSPGATWVVHHDYSTALHNASVASRPRGSGLEAGVRTSLERIALLRASLTELDVAERLAGSPATLALVHAARARSLAQWGLPVEAMEAYQRAADLDPASADYRERAARLRNALHRPLEVAAESAP